MAKLYTRSIVARSSAPVFFYEGEEDYYVRSLGRGLWSVRVISDDDSLGRAVHVRTAELERKYLRQSPETEVRIYKA